MKLYLSSYMIGDHLDRLISLAGGDGASMAVITNALDYIPDEARKAYARSGRDPVAYCTSQGFVASALDLRDYFGRTDALLAVLSKFKVVWAVGGNSFLLRRAMRHSGFDLIVSVLLERGQVYGGWSAGSCVAGDSLRAVAEMDEPNRLAPGYPDEQPVWDGLGLVPFTIVPHFDSDHAEAVGASKAAAWAVTNRIDHRTLQDGAVVVVDGGPPEILPPI
jgi:dipeptidase E